jgi:hypothetical protein
MTERRRRRLRLKTSYNPAPDIWNTARRPIWARAVLKKPIPETWRFACQLERVEITTPFASVTVGGGVELGMTVAPGVMLPRA